MTTNYEKIYNFNLENSNVLDIQSKFNCRVKTKGKLSVRMNHLLSKSTKEDRTCANVFCIMWEKFTHSSGKKKEYQQNISSKYHVVKM